MCLKMGLFLKTRVSTFFQCFNAAVGSIKMLKNFQSLQLKRKILKHFMSPREQYACKKLFIVPRNKTFLGLWKKGFSMKTFRNIQIFAFQMLRECSSWACRNGGV